MLNIVLFGPPGAGKGTQSAMIIEKYALTHLSTGDLFRKHLSDATDLGRLAQGYMDAGNLVPDEVVIRMVEERIDEVPGTHGFIFDGFPRTVTQAEALDRMLQKRGTPISGMIALEVEDDELRNRIRLRGLTSGRTDDQDEEKINNRIRVYKEETLPVMGHYQNQGKFFSAAGVGGIGEIFDRLCAIIDHLEGR
jgi:adenylate kinase